MCEAQRAIYINNDYSIMWLKCDREGSQLRYILDNKQTLIVSGTIYY